MRFPVSDLPGGATAPNPSTRPSSPTTTSARPARRAGPRRRPDRPTTSLTVVALLVASLLAPALPPLPADAAPVRPDGAVTAAASAGGGEPAGGNAGGPAAGVPRAAVLPPQGLYEDCAPGEAACVGHLSTMAAAGFKLVVNYGQFYATPAEQMAYADRANALGMKIIWGMNDPVWWNGTNLRSVFTDLGATCGCTTNAAFVTYVVNLVKNHPATWGYYIADEPTPGQHAAVLAFANQVKAADPNHPRLFVSGEDASTLGSNLRPFVDTCDVCAADVYPIGVTASPATDPIASVGAVQRAISAFGKPVGLVLQAFSWGQYPEETWVPNPRWPTRTELRQMRDQAINNGSPTVLLWYSYFDILRADGGAPGAHWADVVAGAFDAAPAVQPTATPVSPPAATPVRTPTPVAGASAATLYPQAGNLQLIMPVRVLDTRTAADSGAQTPIGFDGTTGAGIAAGRLPANQIVRFALAGRSFGGVGIPAGITGAMLNVTIVQNAPSGGYVTVFPGDQTVAPRTSVVNPSTAVAANFASIGLPANGTFGVFSTNALHVVVDLVGYWLPAGAGGSSVGPLKFVSPVRVVDTRADATAAGPIGFDQSGRRIASGGLTAGGGVRRYLIAGQSFGTSGGAVQFPADTAGIVAHVTVVGAPGGGFVTLYPGNAASPPGASTVNPSAPVSFNSWVTGLSPAGALYPGTVAVNSLADVDLIVDVLGYFAPSNAATGGAGTLTLHTPVRVLDTRAAADNGTGPIGFDGATGSPIAATSLAPNATRSFRVAGKTFAGLALPAGVTGVLCNVTIVQAAPSGGYVTAYPGDAALPNVSTVNPSTAVAASWWANGLPTTGGQSGNEAVFSTNATHVIVDVVGYFK